jgi:hypothetical protein
MFSVGKNLEKPPSQMLSTPPFKSLILAASLILSVLSLKGETVWWEAEDSTDASMTTDGPYVPKGDDLENISGGQWLNGKVEDGLYAEYQVKIAEGGRYTFFVRKFWLHGAFRWRFDDGDWVTVQGLKQTVVDQVKLTANGPVSWIDLGYVQLTPGTHKLRIEMVTDTDFQFNKGYAFDCFALSNDGFAPKGTSKEGGPRQAPPKVSQEDLGRFLPRTMKLLESATPEHRTPIYILCYGQSIIANSHIDAALSKYFAEKYPNADIKIKNTAIGGYQAPILRKTAWQDLYPENPDLVIFHVYGGEGGELEEIFKGMKDNMTADVLTWTHHVDNFGIGIDNQRDESSEFLKKMAAKYGYEIADVRALWKERLKETHLEAKEFLIDQIHLNPKGTALLKEALIPHFQTNAKASPEWDKRIHTISLAQPAPGVSYDANSWSVADGGLVSQGTKPLRVEFVGNRVDIVALNSSTGSAKILLDGKAPSTERDTLAVGRSTVAPGSWFPAVSQVSLGDNAVVEKVTLNFHDVTPDGSSYVFDVKGSVSGDEGSGKAGEDFVAASKRFSIKADDVVISTVKKVTKKDLPPQFTVEWDVHSMSKDTWSMKSKLKPGAVPQDTVVRCWKDGQHVLEIIPDGNGPIALKELLVFSPHGQG